MNANLVVTQMLVAALAVVMFGLGLALRLEDFTRLLKHPKAVAVALVLQIVLLPLACYGLIVALEVPPLFAVGLMLLPPHRVACRPTCSVTCLAAIWP